MWGHDGVARMAGASVSSPPFGLAAVWRSTRERRGGTQPKASKERDIVEAAVQSITDRRVQIQYAAEGLWPSADKVNAPIRREFQLPTDRPFNG